MTLVNRGLNVAADTGCRRFACRPGVFPLLLVAGLALALEGCSLSGSDRPEPNDSPEIPAPPAPPDDGPDGAGLLRPGHETRIDSIIDRVQFAFKPQGAAFTAGHSTHAAAVSGGVLHLTPYHHPDGETAVTGAPIELETAAIYRGATRVDAAYRSAAIQLDSGHLRIARGAVNEELVNHEGGVEQSWRFEAAPGSEAAPQIKF